MHMQANQNIALYFLHTPYFYVKDSILCSLFCTYLFPLGGLPITRGLLYRFIDSHCIGVINYLTSPLLTDIWLFQFSAVFSGWPQGPEGSDHCCPPPDALAGLQSVQHRRLAGMRMAWRKFLTGLYQQWEVLETCLESKLGMKELS